MPSRRAFGVWLEGFGVGLKGFQMAVPSTMVRVHPRGHPGSSCSAQPRDEQLLLGLQAVLILLVFIVAAALCRRKFR